VSHTQCSLNPARGTVALGPLLAGLTLGLVAILTTSAAAAPEEPGKVEAGFGEPRKGTSPPARAR